MSSANEHKANAHIQNIKYTLFHKNAGHIRFIVNLITIIEYDVLDLDVLELASPNSNIAVSISNSSVNACRSSTEAKFGLRNSGKKRHLTPPPVVRSWITHDK